MHFSTASSLLFTALYFGFGKAATSTSAAPAATHTIAVGAEGFTFTPNEISAQVGETLLFLFYPSNHSVARADYAKPCYPYEDSGPGRVGFFSGFHPLNVVSSNPPSFQVVVNDTQPLFFYCTAPGACHDDGMVGVVNPNSTETLAAQVEFAQNSTIGFSPGEGFPQEQSSSTTSTSATPTSTSSTSTSSIVPATTTSAIPTPTVIVQAKSSSLSGGAIAGIAIGGAFVLLVAFTLVYFCARQGAKGEILSRAQNQPPMGTPGHFSMASSTTYPTKGPFMEMNSMQNHRFSKTDEFYGNAATETESHRSPSPSPEEHRESMIPRSSSPVVRRPIPQAPNRQSQASPISPPDETNNLMSATYMPQASNINRGASQRGPHELDGKNKPQRGAYPPPEFER